MEIGKEEPAIYIEPIEDPYRRDPKPQEQPVKEPVKVPEREKVPA